MGTREFFKAVKQSGLDFMNDNCPRLAAALAYYTAFSLPPLLVIIVTLLSVVLDPQTVERAIYDQTRNIVGDSGAEQIKTMLQSAQASDFDTITGLLGLGALILGAAGVMLALQDALNTVWQVKPDPNRGGVKNFLSKRLISFGMVLGIAFLLLVSLVLTAVLSGLNDFATENFNGEFWGPVFQVVNQVVSFAVITGLFAAMFRYLPDAKVEWRDVWVGAAITALLFTLGKLALGIYLGQRDLGSVYGAAGSLALILVWVYYTAMILFYGAEFTQVWARYRGRRIKPENGAVRVVEKEVVGAEAEMESRLE